MDTVIFISGHSLEQYPKAIFRVRQSFRWLEHIPCLSVLLKKNGAHARPSCRSNESSNIFRGKCLWWGLFFTKDASQEFVPAIILKIGSHVRSSRSLF